MKKEKKYWLVIVLVSIFFITAIDLPKVIGQESKKEITILFTHDLHDNFLPVKDEQDGLLRESGGYARLYSTILKQKDTDPEALLLDAGDFSMGTPYQTIFSTEAPGLRLMGKMGYDVVTLGNHEYDYRAEGLALSLISAVKSGERLPEIVQSNVIFPVDENGRLTSSLENLKLAYHQYGLKDYTIIERKGIKVGIFGLMGKDAASKAPMSEVKFDDPVENAKQVVKILKEQEKADLIIALSHTGTWPDKSKSEDEILAREVPEIDVIISGHTHEKLVEPIIVGDTIIGSSEDSGKYLGVIKISQKPDTGWNLDDYYLQPVDDEVIADKVISENIRHYKQLVNEEYFSLFDLNFDQVLAVSPFSFNSVNEISERHDEEPLGNLISDAYIYAVEKAEGDHYIPVDAAIVPEGTIRSSFFKGSITAADVFNVSSLGIGPDKIAGYPLISVYLTGKELKTVAEVDASVAPIMNDAELFISGMNYTFNPNRLIFNKVIRTSLQKPDGSEEEIQDGKLYRVVAGLYSAQMLSVVGEKSYGLLSIVPKTKEEAPVTDFEAQIIKDIASGSNNEVKEWVAIAEYLQSFEQADGLSQIPDYYNGMHGRKIVDNNTNIFALLSSPNKIASTVYAVGIFLIALIIFLTYKITVRVKRRKQQTQVPEKSINILQ